MKNIKFLSLIAFGVIMIFAGSCDQAEGRVTFEGPYYVQFTSSAASISEEQTSSVISVQVSNVGPTLDQDITVNYSTEGSTAELDVDYEIVGTAVAGEIIIPAGKHFGTVKFRTIDNGDADGVKTLNLTLSGASNGLSAGSGAIGVNYALTITDDDCPLDLSTFPGSYDLNFTHTAGFLWAAGYQEGFVATLSATSTANVFDCENFFGIVDREALGTLGSPSLGVIPIEIDEDAKTAAVSAGAHFFYLSGGTAQRDIVGTGSGAVGTCGPSFSLSADVVRTADSSIGTSITVMNFTKID